MSQRNFRDTLRDLEWDAYQKTTPDPIAQCPVCLDEVSQEPKLLSCGHTLCLRCTRKLAVADEDYRVSIACPVCRAKTAVERGISGMPNNYALKDMAEKFKKEKIDDLLAKKERERDHYTETDRLRRQVSQLEGSRHAVCESCIGGYAESDSHWCLEAACAKTVKMWKETIRVGDATETVTYYEWVTKKMCMRCVLHNHRDHDTVEAGDKVKMSSQTRLHMAIVGHYRRKMELMAAFSAKPELETVLHGWTLRFEAAFKQLTHPIRPILDGTLDAINNEIKSLLSDGDKLIADFVGSAVNVKMEEPSLE